MALALSVEATFSAAASAAEVDGAAVSDEAAAGVVGAFAEAACFGFSPCVCDRNRTGVLRNPARCVKEVKVRCCWLPMHMRDAAAAVAAATLCADETGIPARHAAM